jgi:flagellar biosynthesis GTPase FlhF
MEASTSNGSDDVKTFRGRSLEELLPQIRAELGPDAIVLRRREGLGGGVGGFFQRPYVEVDARAPHSGERPLEIRSDRATIEGLSSPAVQALFEQATPFADALAAAARETRTEEDTFSAAMFGGDSTRQAAPPPHPDHPTSTEPRRARETSEFMPSDDPFDEPSASGLYGPQPNAQAIARATKPAPTGADWQPPASEPRPAVATPPAAAAQQPPGTPPAAEPQGAGTPPVDAGGTFPVDPGATGSPAAGAPPVDAAPAAPPPAAATQRSTEAPTFEIPPSPVVPIVPPAPGVERPEAADAAEQRLITAGLSPALAADVVGEAVVHGLPFSAPRNVKKLIRAALARRIPVLTELGPGPRMLAFIGSGGAGKSSAVGHLAAAYVQAGADVAVISLRGDGTLANRLHPLGIGVISADDATQAKQRLGTRKPLVVLVDTPAAGASTSAADVKKLAADLKALKPSEVHLALPATLSSAAAAEVAAALASLGPTHIALTHTDETARPGAPLELALNAGRPVSYVCSRDGAAPADPGALAQQLLP